MFEFFANLDRRWIFLLMLLAVAVPTFILGRTGYTFPEKSTQLSRQVFKEIEQLNEGAPVLLSFDYDPASEGELDPLATAFVRHCAEKKLRMVFMSLWPVGPQKIDEAIRRVIEADFPELVYGEDYVNLGFKSGNEGVIKVIVTDLRQLYTTDGRGTSIDNLPIMQGLRNVQNFDLVINVKHHEIGKLADYEQWLRDAVQRLDSATR